MMSEDNEPEGDPMAPGYEPAGTDGSGDNGVAASSVSAWLGEKGPFRQRRLAVLTFFMCLATLAGSIVAWAHMGGSRTASSNAGGVGGAVVNPGGRGAGSHGAGSHSGFSCAATGSSATARLAVTGLRRNGSGDDFAAIQNAIDSAGQRGGGIVALPAGTFVIDSHLVMKDNVELTGVGPATVIKAGPGFLSAQDPGGGYPLITTAGASNTTIADLTADQSGDTLNGNLPARLAGYVVEGYHSSNAVIDGVYVRNPFTYSIAMVRSTNFCVENCNVKVTTGNRYDQLDGIHILDSNTGRVINNVIQSEDDGLVAHTIGAPVYNVLYANNNVYGGRIADGMQLAVGNFPIHDLLVEDNNFYGSQFGVRTGYYDSRTGAVYNILIRGNYIHNLSRGRVFPAIEIGGFGGLGSIKNITIMNNRACAAGIVTVQPGPGNTVAGTRGCRAAARQLETAPRSMAAGTARDCRRCAHGMRIPPGRL